MNIFKKIAKFILRKRTPSYPNKHDNGVIEFAFRCGGVDYYKFNQVADMPVLRAFYAMGKWQEFEAKASNKHLIAYLDAVEVANNKQNNNQIAVLTNQLRERLDWLFDIETVYEIAAAYYFDKNESLYEINELHNKKKIENWVQNGAASFFLSMNLKQYLPHFVMQKEHLVEYLEGMRLMDIKQKSKILEILHQVPSLISSQQYTAGRVETLRKLKV